MHRFIFRLIVCFSISNYSYAFISVIVLQYRDKKWYLTRFAHLLNFSFIRFYQCRMAYPFRCDCVINITFFLSLSHRHFLVFHLISLLNFFLFLSFSLLCFLSLELPTHADTHTQRWIHARFWIGLMRTDLFIVWWSQFSSTAAHSHTASNSQWVYSFFSYRMTVLIEISFMWTVQR